MLPLVKRILVKAVSHLDCKTGMHSSDADKFAVFALVHDSSASSQKKLGAVRTAIKASTFDSHIPRSQSRLAPALGLYNLRGLT
jgi:hypothetical protein